MTYNKVELNDEIIIDLSGDTVTEADVLEGKTFHGNDGEEKVGTLVSENKLAKFINGDINDITADELEGVVTIKKFAFSTSNLASIEFPSSLKTIDNYALQDNTKLTTVDCSKATLLRSIGMNAFYKDTALTSLTFNSNIGPIYGTAFYGCSALESISFPRNITVPTLPSTTAFGELPSTLKIYIPAALYDSWTTATNWSALSYEYIAIEE